MSAQHTPGPWKFEGFDDGFLHTVDRTDAVHYYEAGHVSAQIDGKWNAICLVNGNDPELNDRTHEQCEADAALIAAAPDLLAALKAMISVYIFDTIKPSEMADHARAAVEAVAKAEGRS